jgi:hypothetical protein
MAKRNLANLIQAETNNQQKTAPAVPVEAITASHQAPPIEQSSTLQPANNNPAPAKFHTLIAKYARLREEQIDQLNALARRLNHAKKGGERITENTLIRVAVDALLLYPERLKGISEEELFISFTQLSDTSD